MSDQNNYEPDDDSNTQNDDSELIRSADEDSAYRDAMYEYFAKHIISDHPDERNKAIQAMNDLECDPRLTDIIQSLLKDSDPEKNTIAVECIGLWKHSDGTSMLIDYMTMVANDYKLSENFKESVLLALGQIGDPMAFEFLVHYSQSEYEHNVGTVSILGMACNESIMAIASRGHESAIQFLISGCRHNAWNMRESCAACLGSLYSGKESLPKAVYEELKRLTNDENRNVRIAAFMSLEEIVGLDKSNKQKLADARNKQIRDEKNVSQNEADHN